MEIVITGGLGYIGSHVAVELSKRGHSIVIIDNLHNSKIGTLESIERLSGTKVKFYEMDINDSDELRKIFSDNNADAVMHFAGLKSVKEAEENPVKYFEVNVGGTISLLSVMEEFTVKRLIFSSSATVYGKPQYLPFDELHPKNPDNIYGKTKSIVEDTLTSISGCDPDWNIVCLRYFNPIGSHQSGLLGDAQKSTPSNLMPLMTKVAMRKLDVLEIFGSNYKTIDGTPVRDYVHVLDIAEGHILALESLENTSGIEMFNLGAGKGISVLELINAFEQETGLTVPYVYKNNRQGDIGSYYASTDKSYKKLGWFSKRSIKEMCVSALNYEAFNSVK